MNKTDMNNHLLDGALKTKQKTDIPVSLFGI